MPAPELFLAPMEGVTDAPLRAFYTERGGFTRCVTEFLRVSQAPPPPKVFHEIMPELSRGARTRAGTPIQLQLLGGDPGLLAESAARGVACGARGIDLNFGCPAPTVNRHDGGATLLKYPDRIRDIVRAVRAAVPAELPVSAKLRLGWDTTDAIHLNADRAIEGGASWITIHSRTRMQGYAPPVFWPVVGEVRRRSPVPVVANGDIWTLDDFKRCRDETGCDWFMLGRGALADPGLPLAVARELGLPAAGDSGARVGASMSDWRPLLHRFAELGREFAPESDLKYLPSRIKQWLRYAQNRGRIDWFDQVKRLETLQQLLTATENQTEPVSDTASGAPSVP